MHTTYYLGKGVFRNFLGSDVFKITSRCLLNFTSGNIFLGNDVGTEIPKIGIPVRAFTQNGHLCRQESEINWSRKKLEVYKDFFWLVQSQINFYLGISTTLMVLYFETVPLLYNFLLRNQFVSYIFMQASYNWFFITS